MERNINSFPALTQQFCNHEDDKFWECNSQDDAVVELSSSSFLNNKPVIYNTSEFSIKNGGGGGACADTTTKEQGWGGRGVRLAVLACLPPNSVPVIPAVVGAGPRQGQG